MVLRIVCTVLLGGVLLAAWDTRPTPRGQNPAPTTATPAPPFSVGAIFTMLPTPAPGTPNPQYTPQPVRVTERAQRSTAMTDGDILADVQQRILAQLPQTADAQTRRTTLQPWQPQVHRYGPGQFAALSPDVASLSVNPATALAVVVVPWGAEAGAVLTRAPQRPVDYLVLIYDPAYQAPSHIVWAPEGGLVQAITGNRSKPTATPAPTANPTVVAAQQTVVARPTTPPGTGDSGPGLQAAR